MGIVLEEIMMFGSEEPLRRIERDEHMLLAPPNPTAPFKLWREHPPLAIVHFPQQYQAAPFVPPRAVYHSDRIRVEWQTMDNRQTFYHRNCDVDELSYQIAGERTLMTELGVVEFRPGEFCRIPRGVAHDNYGRKESHLLFYVRGPVEELVDNLRTSEPAMPPFPGWQPALLNEWVTCLLRPDDDMAFFDIDEQRIFDQVHHEKERMQVLRGPEKHGETWLYGSASVRLGILRLAAGTDGQRYRRTLDADEIQYQISGRRALITQRGIAELEPGDFVRVPRGVAHTSICNESSQHMIVHVDREVPQVAESSRAAQPYSPQQLAALRAGMKPSDGDVLRSDAR